MKKRIKAIFFDAGNTLIFINFKIIKKILEDFNVKTSLSDLKESEMKWRTSLERDIEKLKHLKDQDILPFYFSQILNYLKLNDDTVKSIVDEIISKHRKKMLWSIFPSSVYKVIKDLRRKGYKIGIISNSDGRLVNQLKSLKVWDLFDLVIDSREVGVEKPDPEIFRLALKKLKVDPAETVYVGDIYSIDIKPAQKLGIKAILFDPGDNQSELHCPRIRRIKEIFDYLE
ncbi:MAG TPA: HAD family hydrolase [Firmicutes bacterium]|nr:HAD family hydrolase [Bacillota bacterium]